MQTSTTVLFWRDETHRDTAQLILRLRHLSAAFDAAAVHSRRCLADSRDILQSVNKQLRDSGGIAAPPSSPVE